MPSSVMGEARVAAMFAANTDGDRQTPATPAKNKPMTKDMRRTQFPPVHGTKQSVAPGERANPVTILWGAGTCSARAQEIRCSLDQKIVWKNRPRPNRLTRKNIRRKFASTVRFLFQLFSPIEHLFDCAREFASPCWVFSSDGKRAWKRSGPASARAGRRKVRVPRVSRGQSLRARASSVG